MAEYIGIKRKVRMVYGFDDVALVPGTITINPEDVDIGFELEGYKRLVFRCY